MATVNKDFKIKHGLVVEGTTATVNGYDLLKKSPADDSYIIDLIGGETLVKSVSDEFLVSGAGALSIDRSVVDAYYDAAGDAAAAQAAAEATASADATAKADAAEAAAISAAATDATEKANAAQAAAEATASADATSKANAAQAAAEATASTDATSKANAALASANSYTDGRETAITTAYQSYADTAESDAKAYTDTRETAITTAYQAYSDTAEADAISSANTYTDGEITTALTTAQGYADTAEANAIAHADALSSGLDIKQAVRVATTVDGSLSSNYENGDVVDGITLVTGDRILIKDQATASENGIYVVNATGAPTRSTNADTTAELSSGAFTFVQLGTENAAKGFVVTSAGTLGTDPVVWSQFSEAGQFITSVGTGLDVSAGVLTVVAETFDVFGSAATAQANANSYTDGRETAITTAYQAYADQAEADAKTYADTADTALQSSIDAKADAANPTITGSLTLDGTGDFVISSDSNIVLDANTTSYLASATAGNEIATEGYVTDAIANAEVDYSGLAGNNIDWTGTQFAVNSAGVAAELTTSDIAEGTNEYFTDAKAKTSAASLLTGASLTNITITGDGELLTITAENGVADSDTDDLTEGTSNLYFTDVRAVDALEAVTPNFTAVELNSVALQVAAITVAPTAGVQVAHGFDKSIYRSAEYLVKVAYGTHTEISKVLLTLDTSDNIAITEYGVVGTNGSASSVSAGVSGVGGVELLVTTANNNSTITVMGTLLV